MSEDASSYQDVVHTLEDLQSTALTLGECSTALFPPAAVLYSCLGAGTSTIGTIAVVSLTVLSSTCTVVLANRAREAEDTASLAALRATADHNIVAGVSLFALQRAISALELSPTTTAGSYAATLLPIALNAAALGAQQHWLLLRTPRVSAGDEESQMGRRD